MSVMTWTREAKCKDCEFIKYFHEGKRKFHKCIKKDMRITLKDSSWCRLELFELRKEYYIQKFEQ
jgi:hypothetical protein